MKFIPSFDSYLNEKKASKPAYRKTRAVNEADESKVPDAIMQAIKQGQLAIDKWASEALPKLKQAATAADAARDRAKKVNTDSAWAEAQKAMIIFDNVTSSWMASPGITSATALNSLDIASYQKVWAYLGTYAYTKITTKASTDSQLASYYPAYDAAGSKQTLAQAMETIKNTTTPGNTNTNTNTDNLVPDDKEPQAPAEPAAQTNQ